ncbi:hypothetical protein JKP88DRAFT_333971 [Tribonema minus]|uniref:Uncharacterized protein n=1 Tax=Tribonema minus TaxID=303371 RepID=A0A835YTS5_9STRA|nr:hypothetical protein JKP88DRAFT_333971 [Tribonema minus]
MDTPPAAAYAANAAAVSDLERLQWDGSCFSTQGIIAYRNAMGTLTRQPQLLTEPQAAVTAAATRRLLQAVSRPDAALRMARKPSQSEPLIVCAALAVADGLLALRSWVAHRSQPTSYPGDAASAAADVAWCALELAARAPLPAPALASQAVLLTAQLFVLAPSRQAEWQRLLHVLQAPVLRAQVLASGGELLPEVVSALVVTCPFAPSDDALLRRTVLAALQLWTPHGSSSSSSSRMYSSWPALCEGMRRAIAHSHERLSAAAGAVLSQMAHVQAGGGSAAAAAAAVAAAGLLQAAQSMARLDAQAEQQQQQQQRAPDAMRATVRTLAAALQRSAAAAATPAAAAPQEPFACGVAAALTLAAPALLRMAQMQLLSVNVDALAAALTNLLVSHGLTTTATDAESPPSPLLWLVPQMFGAAAALATGASAQARLSCARVLSDAAQAIAHLNSITMSEPRSSQVVVLSAAAFDGYIAFLDALTSSQLQAPAGSDAPAQQLQLWTALLELLSCMGGARAGAAYDARTRRQCRATPEDVLLRIAAAAEGQGAGAMREMLGQLPLPQQLFRRDAREHLADRLQPLACQAAPTAGAPAAAAAAAANTGANGAADARLWGGDFAWPYVKLAERWVPLVGHLSHAPLVERVVPLLLACARGASPALGISAATAAAAHSTVWTLVSYPYILQGSPVPADASNRSSGSSSSSSAGGTAAAAPHEARHRLACAYFAEVLRCCGDMGAVAAAVGLVVGGLAQVESDQGVALHCLNALRGAAAELVSGDPKLTGQRTRAHTSLLFQTLKIVPLRLLPLTQRIVAEFLGDVEGVLGPAEGARMGAALFEAIAYQCEPSRRHALCSWYQRLAKARL